MRSSLLLLSVAALAAACDDHPAANRKDEAPITEPTAESAPSGPASKGPTGPPELSEESEPLLSAALSVREDRFAAKDVGEHVDPWIEYFARSK